MTAKTAGGVLLDLLERVNDPAAVERMLEPGNLRTILHGAGWTDAQIRDALERDRLMPGELLQRVLDAGHTPAALLAMLPSAPPPGLASAPAAPAVSTPAFRATPSFPGAGTPVQPSYTLGQAFGVRQPLQRIAMYALFLAGILPAMVMAGVFPLESPPDVVLWYGIAGIGGAIAGPVFAIGRGSWPAGALGFAIANVGGIAVTTAWLEGRDEFFRIELVLAFCLGMIPGAGIYYGLSRRAVRNGSLPVHR